MRTFVLRSARAAALAGRMCTLSCIGTTLAPSLVVARLVFGSPLSLAFSRLFLVWVRIFVVIGEGCMNSSSTCTYYLCPLRCACLLLALSLCQAAVLGCYRVLVPPHTTSLLAHRIAFSLHPILHPRIASGLAHSPTIASASSRVSYHTATARIR
ncbi:hypothetical protein C8Q80DRAFT_392933 [Daedaleopsis nitida]|nr:hypothetical protein C8Q80DRAFT_392933 [Daedaleopsis nitida]